MDGSPNKTGSRPRPSPRPEPRTRYLFLKLVVAFKESFYEEGLQAPTRPARSGAGLNASQAQGRRDSEREIPNPIPYKGTQTTTDPRVSAKAV